MDGLTGGGQAGYNFQFSGPWLLGFEADLQASGESGTRAFADQFASSVPTGFEISPDQTGFVFSPLAGTVLTDYEAKIDWFGTLRARAGFLVTNQLAIFGTGGLAYGHVKLSGVSTTNATISETDITTFTSDTTAISASKTNVGYSVGGGIEGAIRLPAKWRWKAEYLYLDLGSLFATAGPISTHARFNDHILRFGLNYGF